MTLACAISLLISFRVTDKEMKRILETKNIGEKASRLFIGSNRSHLGGANNQIAAQMYQSEAFKCRRGLYDDFLPSRCHFLSHWQFFILLLSKMNFLQSKK